MFAVCDTMSCLSEAFVFRSSFVDSIIRFTKLNSDCTSCTVYSDRVGKSRPADFQFVCLLTRKQMLSIVDKYS